MFGHGDLGYLTWFPAVRVWNCYCGDSWETGIGYGSLQQLAELIWDDDEE